jgi:hypothetical protein
MKREIFECDLCHKEYDENSTTYATIYSFKNGSVNARMDICNECTNKMIELIEAYSNEIGDK